MIEINGKKKKRKEKKETRAYETSMQTIKQ